MSTRSQILFRDRREWEEDGERIEKVDDVLTYKHHDGYPKGTVPLMRRYFQYAKARSNDIEYFTATWMYWYKRRRERHHRYSTYGDDEPLEAKSSDTEEDEFEMPKQLTGLGICGSDHIHGDINYFWVVRLDEKLLEMYKMSGWAGDDYDTYKDIIGGTEPDKIFELDVEDPQKGFEE